MCICVCVCVCVCVCLTNLNGKEESNVFLSFGAPFRFKIKRTPLEELLVGVGGAEDLRVCVCVCVGEIMNDRGNDCM